MMQFFKDNKMLFGGIAAVILVAYVYFTYFAGSSPEPLTTSDTSSVSSSLLATLTSVRTIKLDNAIFSDPVFLSLTDFGVQLPPQNVGRRNPFAPLGSK